MSADARILRLTGPHIEGRLILADDLESIVRDEYADADPADLDEAIAELAHAGSSAWLDLSTEPVEVSDLEDYDWAHLVGACLEAGTAWRESGVTLSADGPLELGRYPDSWRGPGQPRPPATGLLLDGDPADVSSGWASVRAQIATAVSSRIEADLTRLARRRRTAEAALEGIRREQHAAMRRAMDGGMSAYRVAKLSGLTERAVHKIRDA